MLHKAFVALCASLLLLACDPSSADEDAGVPDAGAERDGGSVVDSGSDAGPLDAGPPDAGPSDAGPPDAGPCDESPCRLQPPQCGCVTGSTCHLNDEDDRACRPIGTRAETEPCSSDDECQAGMQCLNHGSGSVCLRYCSEDADCSGDGAFCIIELRDDFGPIDGATLCTPPCDPLDTASCGPTLACTLGVERSGRHFTQCRPQGTLTAGEECGAEPECGAGHFCTDFGAGRQCIRYCIEGRGDCPAGQRCRPLNRGTAVVGDRVYGGCEPDPTTR